MNLIITRYQSDGLGSFGKLEISGHDEILATVEKPWRNNKRFISCLPAGKYRLVPFSSPKYGDVLCIVSDDGSVVMYESEGCDRYACLFHVANYARNVKGCVGIGQHHHNNMVTNSKKSLEKLFSMVNPQEEHSLIIQWGEK